MTDKLFKVTTSPVKADGTFDATFTSLINYTGGGSLSGLWKFGDGKTMKYNGTKPFTHHGYRGGRNYSVRLQVVKNYNRNIGQPNQKVEQYIQTKTIEIGASGHQSNATFIQTSKT